MTYRKKLIEVALPLAEINDASAYDKMPGIGPHPKGIHHWWARLPLPTARAVLFASVVDDPSAHPERFPTEDAQNAERERLFGIVRRLMQKKLHEHPEVYAEARAEMLKQCNGNLPPVFDPFAGGGSIPLEANRLGFEAHAGDLNPVAVLLNKCNLELAPRWAGHPPVNPPARAKIGGTESWTGTHGLAADVRHYGARIRQKAIEKIGHLYPQVQVVRERDGTYRHATDDEIRKKSSKVENLNVIAWIWARTVVSPNPAARGAHVPLLSTYWLSSKKGQLAWLEPIIDRKANIHRFEVRTGTPGDRNAVKAGTKLSSKGFRCLLTDSPIEFEYIRDESRKGRVGQVLVAVVLEMLRGRTYLPAEDGQIGAARAAHPSGFPESDLPEEALGFRIQNYGIRKHWQMFTPRQLTAMVTLSDLIRGARSEIEADAKRAGHLTADATAYAQAVTTFLALALDRCADFNNALCGWSSTNQKVMHLFGRQAIPMVWDFSEANILGESVGAWFTCNQYVADCIEVIGSASGGSGKGMQIDAASAWNGASQLLVSTDPPYYDNIGYAALSDFFYVWLRAPSVTCIPISFRPSSCPKPPS